MDDRKALDARASGLMVVLCMIWGLQQVILKMAAPDISPIMQIALRSGLAAVLVLPLLYREKNIQLLAPAYLRSGLLVAFFFALEFFLLAEAIRHTYASHTVVLLYTAPIFVALGLHWKLPAERLSILQCSGIGIAFLGVILTFIRPQTVQGIDTRSILWGDGLALMAAIAWAATTISIRLTPLSQAPATQTMFYQMLGGFIVLMIVAWITGQTQIHFTPLAVGSLIFHTFVVSFASFLAWFWLLRTYLASRLGVFSFLTPIFGMGFGVYLLNEKLELNFLIGTALVLLGVIVVSLPGWIQSKRLKI
ncbi:DMT family transporter [Acinetobacter ursingii]|uniref:DMT family transporter n=1 Tax=Acinetobacter ursingii TaxID=108980 RepID=UPI0021CD99C0|nr:DMT family transporter [Acinetobacter ursingii]MCU4483621.1 DMT family transporter [Acinetobacter ursingii]MCU4507931.1 DMT family transporter [Acinetobacter ursingii]MCU4570845.1 DMT family transporter [Acinetobacter ursingii]